MLKIQHQFNHVSERYVLTCVWLSDFDPNFKY